MNTLCPVCQDELGVPSFKVATSTTDVATTITDVTTTTEGTFRLGCGHAFHVDCLVPALLSAPRCPVCRAGGADASAALHVETDDEDLSIAEGDNPEAALIRERLHEVRTRVSAVRMARSRAWEIRREYCKVRDTLRRARRKHVTDALIVFRHTHQREWRRVSNKMSVALKKLKAAEQQALAAQFGFDGTVPDFEYSGFRDSTFFVGNNTSNPESRRFWVGREV